MPALQLQGQGGQLGHNIPDGGFRVFPQAGAVAGCPVGTGCLAKSSPRSNSAGQGVGQLRPVIRDRNGNCLPRRIAVEVVGTCPTGLSADKLRIVLTHQVDDGGAVINAGQLFRRIDQTVKLDLHLVPGLELGGLGEDLAVRIQEVIADAPGGDHLVGLNAVLLHAEDVPAGSEAGNRHGAVGGHGDAAVGKAVKGHLVGDGGAGHGDGAAFLGLKAVGCTCIAQVEQDVVLGIQCLLRIAAYGGIHPVHGHVGGNGGAIRPHGHHEHAGALRPDGGEAAVFLVAGLALHMGHGVIGHQDDGRAGLIGLHIRQGAVVLVGGDGHHIAGLTVQVHHGVMHIRQGDLGIHKVLNGLPAAEHVQLPGLALLQVQIALLIDIQVYITQVINILIEAVHRVLGEGLVPNVQVVLGHIEGSACLVLAKGPVGHAVRVLHTEEVVLAGLRQEEGDGHGVALGLGRQRLGEVIDIVVAELAHADSGPGGGGDGDGHSRGDLCADIGRAVCLYRNSNGIIIRRLIPHRGQGDLCIVALDKNAGGAEGAPVGGGTRLGLAVHAVGADHLIVNGVVGVLDPAAVGGIDLIDPLESNLLGVRRHGDDDAAVILPGSVVALYPVVAGRQLHIGIVPGAVVVGSFHSLAGQQVHIALDAVGIGIQLQGVQLHFVQALEIQGDHGDLLDLGRGIHQGIDFLFVVAHGGEVAGEAVVHSEGGLAVLIGDSAFNNGHSAGLGIHPAQLGPLQGLGRSLQLGRGLVQVGTRSVEACNGGRDLLAHMHFGGSIHPGVIIGIGIVRIRVKVHHVAIEQRGVGDHGAVVAAIGGGSTVIGIPLVYKETAGVGLNAENLGDPAAAAHSQVLPGCFLGKGLTKDQLMGLDQGVQGGHALQCIGKAVFLGFKGGDLHLLKRMEIAARHLGAERHLHGGRGRLLHSDGVLLGLFSLVHAGPGGIAALHGDDGAVHHGNLRRALILRAVHAGADLEVLVAGGGRHHHAADIGGQLQRVAVGVLMEGGRQLAGTEGQGLDGGVIVAPAAAQVIAIGAGVHDADLIAGFQLAGSHGKGGEALVGKPVVEGAHPAGLTAAVKLRQAVDLADVGSAGMGVSLGVQRLKDTAHHGGILGELHPGIHQRAGPGRSFTIHRFCEGSVFHDDMGLAQVIGRCQHGGGHQGQGHHQCQQQG